MFNWQELHSTFSLVYLLQIDMAMTLAAYKSIIKADNRHVKMINERNSVFQILYNKTLTKDKGEFSLRIDQVIVISKFKC